MQTINLDLSTKNIVPLLHTKQGDVGRKFTAVITDAGEPCDLADAAFSVWYTGTSGEGNYTDVGDNSAFSVDGNTVTVELITQMLVNAGNGTLCLVMNSADGGQLGTWNIPYCVEAVPGANSQEAQMYYTAFQRAVADLPYPDPSLSVAGKAADAAATGAVLAGKAPAGYGVGMQLANTQRLADLNNASLLTGYYSYTSTTANLPNKENFGGGFVLVENHIADSVVYQTIVNNSPYIICKRRYYNGTWSEWEWVNPPMEQGKEYRTTERVWGNAVYKKLFYFGFLPNSAETGTAHGVENLSQVVKVTLLAQGLNTYLNHNPQITKINVDGEKVYITTNANLSSTRCYVLLEYCKV